MRIPPIVTAITLLLSLANAGAAAQTGAGTENAQSPTSPIDTTAVHGIERVVVVGRRLQDIGVQRTVLDTAVLHDNISSSMAGVLTQSSTIFIKTFGRATLSTASFRGTSASHTQVTWNGMRLTSPMLGMVDFSMIPSYFIDEATLLHGTSSVGVTGGGLGGAVTLATKASRERGPGLQYIQGVGSFRTFDEYLRITYGGGRWHLSTRATLSSSANDFKYRNYNKRVNEVWDGGRNLVSWDYPVERNRSGGFNDFHLLQEIYYDTRAGDRFSLAAWYTGSVRGVPMLDVDYKDDAGYRNEQRERTLRGVVSWDRTGERLSLGAKGGYLHTSLGYDYRRDRGNGERVSMIRSRSRVNTLYGMFDADYFPNKKWMFTAGLSLHQHFVESRDDNVISQSGDKAVVGYDKARVELSACLSVRWKPGERFGASVALREDMYGSRFAPFVPAAFVDYLLSRRGNVLLKASVSRNYRFPTLNDLYFLPGGNPDLRTERGFSYDGGVEFTLARGEGFSFKGEATAFDSYIDDWIAWLPTFKGFWSPVNIKRVHAYGVELKGSLAWRPSPGWAVKLDGNYSWTPSINHGDPVNWADESIGRQLVWVPLHSSAVTGRLSWKTWSFTYKWCWYSERFTTSSNETATRAGVMPAYFMSDVSLEKRLSLPRVEVSLKGVVNNLFDEEYQTVLSRPMPRMNFEFFIELKPKFFR